MLARRQLRPKVNSYALTVEQGDGYDLNRSLFERLVLKGFPHQTLNSQHRMRPEISDLVRQLTYPNLKDAVSTLGRPAIRGLQDSLIFWSHSNPEEELKNASELRDGGSKASKQNAYESRMVLRVVRYLSQQGESPRLFPENQTRTTAYALDQDIAATRWSSSRLTWAS